MTTCLSCSSCARTHIQTFICESSQILCDAWHTELYKKMSWSCQWGIWQHELYQQIHSSNMSRPSHLCICQYIQHPLPLLVECSIPSSRCGCLNVIFPIFIAHRVLGSFLIISLVCSLCCFSFLILSRICSCGCSVNLFGAPNSYAPNALATSSTFLPLNISQYYIPFGFAYFYTFISISNSMSCIKGEVDIGIRLLSRTWTSLFFPDGLVVMFLNMILLKCCFV